MKPFVSVFIAAFLASPVHAAKPAPEQKPAVPAAPAPSCAQATNAFALALHKKLAAGKSGENLAFSPVSLATALAMTSAGAAGDTEKEMLKTLRLDRIEKPHEAMGSLLKSLASEDNQTTVALAQGIWLKKGLNLTSGFSKTATDQYQAANEVLDFADASKALERLNGWISQHTNERITDLFDAQSVRKDTQLVLASALYFKSLWATPFKPEDTREDVFKLTAKKTVKTSFMHRSGKMDYTESKALQALRLPYTSKDWSLVVLLPRETTGLASLEAGLDVETMEKIITGLKPQKTELALPRFTTRTKLDIRGSLQALGMKLAFGDDADFSRLCENGRGLMISKVLHQTFVEVTEEGTEAAAATGIVMRPKGMVMEEKPKAFIADHPFLYLIRHEPSGTVVFLGRMTNPAVARAP